MNTPTHNNKMGLNSDIFINKIHDRLHFGEQINFTKLITRHLLRIPNVLSHIFGMIGAQQF
jgi:hypothetical protein